MTFDHDALRDLAVAYAFGTLDASERQAFEAHLQTCMECQEEVRAAARLAEGLAYVPQEAPLPPDLRDRVLRNAMLEPFQPDVVAVAPVAARAWPSWFALAASLVAIVALGVAWTEHRQSMSARADASRDRQQAAEAQQALSLVQESAADTRRAMDIAIAPDVKPVTLAGQASAPAAGGRVFWSASRGLFLTAANLPALPSGRIYQLWYVTAGAPVSAALLQPDASGQVRVIQASAVDVQPKAFALTIEPAGGVPAPTGAMFLLGSL